MNEKKADSRRPEAQAAERRYQELVDSLNALVWEVETKTFRCTYVNEQVERLLGYKSVDWLNIPNFWAEHVFPADRERAVGITLAAVTGGRDHEFEYRFLRADGEVVWLRNMVRVVRAENGGVALLRGFTLDITDRKRAEEDQRWLRATVEAANDLIGVSDMRGWMRYLNPAGRRMLGIGPDEDLTSLCYYDFMTEASRRMLLEEVVPKRQEQTHWQGEVTLVHRDGKHTPVSLLGIVHSDEEGRPAYAGAIARDISPFYEAKTKLRESEERYRSLVDLLPDAVFVHREGTIVFVNRAAVELMRVQSDQDLIGRQVLDLIHPDFKSTVTERIRRIRERGEGAPLLEERFIRADGTVVDVDVTAIPFNYGGTPAVQAVVRDISERKRAEESQRETADTLQAIIESSPLAIIALDPTGRVRSWNPAAERLYGWSAEEVLDQPLPTVPADRVEEGRMVRQRALQGETVLSVELERQRKDGTRRKIRSSIAPLHDADNSVIGIVAVQADITAHQKAEEELRRREEHYRALIENAPDMIVVLDDVGMVTYQSPSVERVMGYPPSELTGRNVFELVHPEDIENVTPVFTRILNNAHSNEPKQFRARHRDGSWREVEAVGTNLIEDPAVNGVVVNFRDMTDRRHLETQLRHAQKMEAIGRLAGGIAHDFNNLLTVIKGYSQVLTNRMDRLDPLFRHVEGIERAADRAGSLTRQLLAFSRRQVLQPRIIDLNAILTDMNKMLQRVIGEDIRLSTVLDPALLRVRADAGQLEQVILNLAVNARDAMPNGGQLTIETRNATLDEPYVREHPEAQAGPFALIAVSDTGCGMSADVQSHLFEPFFTTKEMGKGTGLGLSTVFGIVRQSGGSIAVYSEVDVGSTFKVYLPATTEAMADDERPRDASGPPPGRETLLVVEDEEGVRNLIAEILRSYGYKVIEASNGREALHVCEEKGEPIQLLVTDVVMPNMGGPELADNLRTRQPGIRVLFLSGYPDTAVLQHGLIESGRAFLQKPFSPEVLAYKVREVLDSK